MAAASQHQRHMLLPEEMAPFMQQPMYDASNPALNHPAGPAPAAMANRLRQGWTAPSSFACSFATAPPVESVQQSGQLPMCDGAAPAGSTLPVGPYFGVVCSSLLGDMSTEPPPPAPYSVPPMQAQLPADGSLLLPPE